MRVVLDTNILISALFFAGLPGRILAAWIDERFEMLASVEILGEYRRVVARLQGRFPSVEAQPLLARSGDPQLPPRRADGGASVGL